jgi:NAD(P)-dependent dehydrogenase (short-subunit alcohol dehydrogenase family)
MAGRLTDTVAIVTGAGSSGPGWGNGKAVAVLFAREGARVYAVDIDERAVAETRAIIEGEGGECSTLVADIATRDGVEAMVDGCLRRFGGLDVLHNSVGVGLVGGLADTSEADWDRLMRVNVKSMFLTCRQAVPMMADAHRADGRIRSVVNVGAVAGRRWTGVPLLAYASSPCWSSRTRRTSCCWRSSTSSSPGTASSRPQAGRRRSRCSIASSQT